MVLSIDVMVFSHGISLCTVASSLSRLTNSLVTVLRGGVLPCGHESRPRLYYSMTGRVGEQREGCDNK